MKYITEQYYTTLAFSPSGTSTLQIGAKSYWTTAYLIEWEINYQTGAAPVVNQDNLFRNITNLQVQGGGRPYLKVGAPDTRILYWDTRHRLRGRCRVPDFDILHASAAAAVLHYSQPIIFGVNPIRTDGNLNFWDTTAAIAPDPDLSFQVTWGVQGSSTTATTWGTNVAANGTTSLLRITAFGVIPEKQTEFPKFYPVWNTSQYSPSATASGLSGTININPGFYYRRTALEFLSGTAPADNRLNGWGSPGNLISEIAVKTIDGRFPLNQKVWDFAQYSQAQFQVADDNYFGSETTGLGDTAVNALASLKYPTNPGTGIIDWVTLADTSDPSKADPFYGLNFVSKQVGALQLAFTVDSTGTSGNATMLHECYLPY